MIKYFQSSLGLKVIGLISAIAIVVLGSIAALTSHRQSETMLDQLSVSMADTADLVREIIEKPMIVGDDEGTKEEFEYLAHKYDDMSVRIVNYKGNLTYSTTASEVRRDFSTVSAAEDINRLLETSLSSNTNKGLYTRVDGKPAFAQIMSIANQPSCHHCHGSSKPILGSMIIVQDVSEAVGTINAQVYETIALCLFGLLTLVGSTALFMRYQIIKRIANLAQASEEVAAGNYSVSFENDRLDELATLAGNFEIMVGEIKSKLGFSEGVLKGIPLPAAIVGPDYNMVWINKQMTDLLAKPNPAAEYIGTRSGAFFWNEENRETLSDRAINSGQREEIQFQRPRRDGKVLDIHAVSTPFYDMDNTLLGSITFWNDQTDIMEQQRIISDQNTKVSEIAAQSAEISNRLAEASEELSKQIDEAHIGADTQQTRTTETAAAMEQMNATVLEVARNASQAAERAETTREKALAGSEIVDRALQAIEEVQTEAENMRTSMDQLGQQAEDIGRIMNVISDIADQTNLLALNAAIEAARAGDAGRGFAVVADEVRKLAERTMDATREVGSAIGSIQQGVRINIDGTTKTTQAVANSTQLSSQSGQALQEIVALVEQSVDEVRAIATAAEEQSATSEQINRSTDEINSIAQQTAILMNESTDAVAALSHLAQELDRLIAAMTE